MIRAEVHSDDYTEETKFDATRTNMDTLIDGYTEQELKSAFEMVHPDDWRDPICTTIHPTLLPIVMKAVEYYTATKVHVEGLGNGDRVIIRADGYRAGPAGP